MKAKYKVLGLTKKEFNSLRGRYQLMKNRCYNPKNNRYSIYGGRGIKICDEWLKSCDAFYEWAIKNGFNQKLTIDRIDTNGNYEPSNCRWVDYFTQSKNRRNIKTYNINGENLTLTEISRKYNISFGKLENRVLKNNIEVNTAISMGNKFSKCQLKVGQFSKEGKLIKIYDRQKDACDELGIKKQNLSICMKNFNKTTGGYKWRYLDWN